MDTKMCYITSGIPGSGKSTWIESQPWYPHSVSSADSFFMKEGQYNFDPTKLAEAHNECIRQFILSCQESYLHVVVDNTNITSEEIAPYYAIAKAHNYSVTLVTCYVSPDIAAKRNKHGVPYFTCAKMAARLEQRVLPSHWNLEQIAL